MPLYPGALKVRSRKALDDEKSDTRVDNQNEKDQWVFDRFSDLENLAYFLNGK